MTSSSKNHKAFVTPKKGVMKNLCLRLATFFSLLFSPHLAASEPSFPPVYSDIKDIYHPTIDDYRLLQQYLSSEKRDLSQLCDFAWVVKNIKIIGESAEELPRSECIAVNCSKEDKENCIILYASFNRNYPQALMRLANLIKTSDFQGHVLYRIGGWPNTEEGDLLLAHVPYAFKVCMFQEAKRLGYKRCLWLDTAFIPVVSLNTIFKMIDEKGYFVVDCSTHKIGPFMNTEAAAAFGLTLEETQKIPSCSAGIFGIDFRNRTGALLVDRLYTAAHDKNAFFSARSDQNALSIILYQSGITDFISLKRIPHTEIGQTVQPDSLFVLDRLFAQNG